MQKGWLIHFKDPVSKTGERVPKIVEDSKTAVPEQMRNKLTSFEGAKGLSSQQVRNSKPSLA